MKRVVFLILTLIFLFGVAGCGKTAGAGEPAQSTDPPGSIAMPTENLNVDLRDDRSLQIDLDADEGAQHTIILPVQPDRQRKTKICFVDVRNVRVELSGTVVSLEDALRDNLVLLDDLIACAGRDAKKGFCHAYMKVRNSGTFVLYRYSEYDLWFAQDISITDLGKQQLVNELYITGNAYGLSEDTQDASHSQEDWGLTFEVVEADATSILLNYTQSGGQQLGKLIADFYYIDRANDYGALRRLENAQDADDDQPVLQRNTSDQIVLDWSNIYGELPSGDYILTLKVSDIYDMGETRVLMSKFEKRQSYLIPFEIP